MNYWQYLIKSRHHRLDTSITDDLVLSYSHNNFDVVPPNWRVLIYGEDVK